MKKFLISLALVLVSNSALAQDLEISNVKFSTGEFGFGAHISFKQTNTTESTIRAWRGNLQCADLFGEIVIDLAITSRSANIPARGSVTGTWVASSWSESAKIVKSNSAENFDCTIANLETVKG